MNPLGSNAADLIVETPGRTPLALYDINSPYKVLYFYSIDCGLCEIVTPKLKELYTEYKDNGIEVIAINTGSDYNKWIKYIGSNNLDWINLWGADNKSQIYDKYYLENVSSIYLLKDNMVISKVISDLVLSELFILI